MLAVIKEGESFDSGTPNQKAPVLTTINKNSDDKATLNLRVIVFGRSVRSSFSTLHVVRVNEQGIPLSDNENDEAVLMIRVQFDGDVVAMRSYCRRFCKLGDLLRIWNDSNSNNNDTTSRDDITMEWQLPDITLETSWRSPRLVMQVPSMEALSRSLSVVQRQIWNMPECQRWQKIYLPITAPVAKKAKKYNRSEFQENNQAVDFSFLGNQPAIWMDQPSSENHHVDNNNSSHCGGLGKRMQGQCVASFLLHMTAHKIDLQSQKYGCLSTLPLDPSTWAQNDIDVKTLNPHLLSAIEYLNSGTGVFDAAGGSGHVSMALSLLGVRCTVIDPRENVGRLPKRDRKIYHRALKQKNPTTMVEPSYCQPVGNPVPFDVLRAWFGNPPDNVDTSFRSQCDVIVDDERLSQCSAIVALHPDEATDAIVDTAVRRRIPFVVVPCCVFYRLFPHRRKPNQEPVSTYDDLVEYLMSKDASIQRSTLPFEGSNTILWSSFGNDESSNED